MTSKGANETAHPADHDAQRWTAQERGKCPATVPDSASACWRWGQAGSTRWGVRGGAQGFPRLSDSHFQLEGSLFLVDDARLPWSRSSPRRTRPRWPGSIASFLKLRKPPPGARSSTCRSQTRTSRFPCWKPGRSLCRNRMLGGPIQPRFTSHAVTIAAAALIASLTSWRVAVG